MGPYQNDPLLYPWPNNASGLLKIESLCLGIDRADPVKCSRVNVSLKSPFLARQLWPAKPFRFAPLATQHLLVQRLQAPKHDS